jgi:hypothetical protein
MQPGTGYTFRLSGSGATLDTERPWPADHGNEGGVSLVIELYRPHPFRITKLTAETGLGAGWFYNLYPDTGSTFFVAPGTVNGTPCALSLTACGSGLTNVYVQTYPDAEIQIIATTSTLTSSDSAAYVLIGQVDQYHKTQFVKSNLLRERYVLGQAEADYHHSYTDLV